MESNQVEEVVFQPGEALFEENQAGYHFFVIQSGQVEIYKTASNQQKIPLAVVGPGVSIGEFAMIDRNPRSATARALTAVVAARVSEEAYQQLLTELPDWAVSVMTGLVDRIRQTNEIIRRSGIVDSRIAHEIQTVEFGNESIAESMAESAAESEDDTPDLA